MEIEVCNYVEGSDGERRWEELEAEEQRRAAARLQDGIMYLAGYETEEPERAAADKISRP